MTAKEDPSPDVSDALMSWLTEGGHDFLPFRFHSRGEDGGFLSGDPEGDRLCVRYFRHRSTQDLLARIWFGPQTQGPPGYVHGGCVAAVLDEAMSAAAWAAGVPVVTARLTVHYGRMVPVNGLYTVEPELAIKQSGAITCQGRLTSSGGRVFATAEARLASIDPGQFKDPLPSRQV